MTTQSPERQRSLSPFVVLGVGWGLSIFWWVLALLSEQPTEEVIPLSLLAALGGFVPALMGLLLVQTALRGDRAERKPSVGRAWTVAGFIALYPLVVVVLLVWGFFQPLSPGLLRVLTHPALLVFNLMAVLLIGPAADLTGLKARTLRSLKQRQPPRVGKGGLLAIWWLWHLPFIFVNGSVLGRVHFSTGILTLYLVTVLGISYLFTWGYDRKGRRVVNAARRHQGEERG